MEKLKEKKYPGRLIILGKDLSGKKVIAVYAITGRSPSSQARRLVRKNNSIWTEAIGERKLRAAKTEILLYPALYLSKGIAIGNGQQTEAVKNNLKPDHNPLQILSSALAEWSYENDPPLFTPRISGCLVSSDKAALSIIKKGEDSFLLRNIFEFPLIPGKGKLISTYQGKNRDLVLSFKGEPEEIELKATNAQDMALAVYLALEPANGEKDLRIAVVSVFSSDLSSDQYEVSIINRYERKYNSDE